MRIDEYSPNYLAGYITGMQRSVHVYEEYSYHTSKFAIKQFMQQGHSFSRQVTNQTMQLNQKPEINISHLVFT